MEQIPAVASSGEESGNTQPWPTPKLSVECYKLSENAGSITTSFQPRDPRQILSTLWVSLYLGVK